MSAGVDDVEDVEDVDVLLARWTAGARADDAARARVRERWLRQQAQEDASFAGVALDLSEASAGVAVRTTTGHTLHGRIATVAGDFCVLRHDGGTVTLVAFAAVASVRPEQGFRAGDAGSERTAPVPARLADVLAGLAVERPRVRMILDGGGEALTGELRAVGSDVATLRLDSGGGATVYVRIGSVGEVTLLG